MLIEIHMLKNYAPTNLNRDDTGAPKTCLFGGVQRSRISSQCLKRSWRKSELLSELVGSENLGIRTRRLPELVAEQLRADGIGEELIALASKKLSGFGNKDGKENSKGNYTAQVVFYAPEDIKAAAGLVKAKIEACKGDKKAFDKLTAKELQAEIKDAKLRPVTLDIALFGRMVTSDAFADVDAAMQVAHAFSTNRLTMEADYFTAMDDLVSGESMDDLGAAIMGDIDYNSSCYYMYASLDTDKLEENLKNVPNRDALMKKAIPAILRVMAYSNPSGKQNTFAGHALPSAVLVECKNERIPVSYANAFVRPAAPGNGNDLVGASIRALTQEVSAMEKDFALPVEKRLWFCSSKYDEPLQDAVPCKNYEALVDALSGCLQKK